MHPQLEGNSNNANSGCSGTICEGADGHDSGMEADDSDDDMDIEPLLGSDDDDDFFLPSIKAKADVAEPYLKSSLEEDDEPPSPKPPPKLSLRQRRMSKSEMLPLLNIQQARGRRGTLFDVQLPESRPRYSGKQNWKRAFAKLKSMKDPWKEFHIEQFEAETAIRHRYNALKKQWVTDEVTVKMQTKPFNHGAMRECFRLKKLSNLTHSKDWARSQNYVAKRYMQEDVSHDVYYEDVVLQMDAKLWGEEFNRHNPPKKVDIFQLSVLEFKNRLGKPLYHLEHFIEGEYIKYNSNSGFVDENIRLTPHAFSHFTFERSGHQLIVVDIQGVGDLYTDPQIHTNDGKGYGDGNLGTRGMALFFYSHACNKICESLSLSSFDMAPSETQTQFKYIQCQKNARTVVRGCEEVCMSPSPQERIDISRFMRVRTLSTCSERSNRSDGEVDSPLESIDSESENGRSVTDDEVAMLVSPPMFFRRHKYMSESEGDTLTEEEERQAFAQAMRRIHRPSCITNEMKLRNNGQDIVIQKVGDSILGQVHHALAKYHEAGRFVMNDNDINWAGALFHEEQAAKLGIMEAIITLAKLHLGLPRDVLSSLTVEETEGNLDTGFQYLLAAANHGDVSSIIQIAETYECGYYNRPKDWGYAVDWYEKALKAIEEADDCEGTVLTPVYQVQAQLAEMYRQGGHNLQADPQKAGDHYNEAAEGAMAAMKGRLATKYYMLAEEVYGECEECEE